MWRRTKGTDPSSKILFPEYGYYGVDGAWFYAQKQNGTPAMAGAEFVKEWLACVGLTDDFYKELLKSVGVEGLSEEDLIMVKKAWDTVQSPEYEAMLAARAGQTVEEYRAFWAGWKPSEKERQRWKDGS